MKTLAIAILCLVLWITFGFVRPMGGGAPHLLLAVGTTLLVRWWALWDQPGCA
ncbi:MAG: hypothetical protein H0U85_04805 [Gemmatimonadales bacterium]|nr:hypothetical protein [Gemmatimonadales bacterium]